MPTSWPWPRPCPARPRPGGSRDFTLTEADAERLRRAASAAGWPASARRVTGSPDPLAIGFTTLGLAGLLAGHRPGGRAARRPWRSRRAGASVRGDGDRPDRGDGFRQLATPVGEPAIADHRDRGIARSEESPIAVIALSSGFLIVGGGPLRRATSRTARAMP